MFIRKLQNFKLVETFYSMYLILDFQFMVYNIFIFVFNVIKKKDCLLFWKNHKTILINFDIDTRS